MAQPDPPKCLCRAGPYHVLSPSKHVVPMSCSWRLDQTDTSKISFLKLSRGDGGRIEEAEPYLHTIAMEGKSFGVVGKMVRQGEGGVGWTEFPQLQAFLELHTVVVDVKTVVVCYSRLTCSSRGLYWSVFVAARSNISILGIIVFLGGFALSQ